MDCQGLLTCARYAFPPNSLRYCGPQKTKNLYFYAQSEQADAGLFAIIKQFQVLYPYLKLIAFENKIADPFDRRVVEAYWLGNSLLDNVSMKSFYYHLLDKQNLKKKIPKKDLKWLVGKIPQGALPHHSFHVFNVFKRTGHQLVSHTLETMDACRIGWGKTVKVQCRKEGEKKGEKLNVLAKPLLLKGGKLALGRPVVKSIEINYEGLRVTKLPPTGSWVSFHWNFFCDLLTFDQVVKLERYTLLSLNLANQTL